MSKRPWGSNLTIDTSRVNPKQLNEILPSATRAYCIERLHESVEPVVLQPTKRSPDNLARTPQSGTVLKDMHDGLTPPKYRSQSPPREQRRKPPSSWIYGQGPSCTSCRKQRSLPSSNESMSNMSGNCRECGKQRASSSPMVLSQTVVPPRSVSEGSSTTLVNASNPNLDQNEPTASTSKCNKCGKARRSRASPMSTDPTEPEATFVPPSRRHVASQHIVYFDASKPPSKMPSDMPRRKPIANPITITPVSNSAADIDIDIIPPTAISERPSSSVFQLPEVDKSPLLNGVPLKERRRIRRSTSIASMASSISRSLSRRRTQSKRNLESPQLSPNLSQNGYESPPTLFNMISNALRGSEPREYSRIDGETESEVQPGSPFSFMNQPRDHSIELSDMANSTQNRGDGFENIDINAAQLKAHASNPFDDPEPLQRPEHLRTRSDTVSKYLESLPVPEGDSFLGHPQRPTELVRFKSLRQGVQRAGSVARSSSVKRLNSLKNAPQFWYRTDMAIEGALVGVY